MDDAVTRGRADLLAWEQSKPDNFFTADRNLQNVLRRLLGERYAQAVPNLTTFGGRAATVLDDWAQVEDRIGNHPRLERYTGTGERIEQIEFHPNHDRAGALIWESGMMALQREPGGVVQQMALFYLLGHNGEGGHMCSIACTSGLIRALQAHGSDALKARFLEPLLRDDYGAMQHGAQFLTEVQGGSDVGANALHAQDAGDGTWRLTGEKWFCSNINADQFLVMARPEGAPDGTRGLAAFLVPRRLDDGTLNAFHIRRLKDKLGTRTLASAELDFTGAVAYPIGALTDGFKITVERVLNTSRLLNAVSCAGVMRRAAIEASSYACTRQAFGQVIASYPLVQEAVADAVSETYAAVASGFALAALLDRIETGAATDDDRAVFRILVNLNKYVTSIRGTEIVHRAIEVLGGNGAIETFSILPRLYRDMVVLESWEGTHNVLCLQVLRDIERYQLHEPFLRFIGQQIGEIRHESLARSRVQVAAAVTRAELMLARIAKQGTVYGQAHARRLADLLAMIAQAALMLNEAQWELDQGLPTIKPDVAAYFCRRHLVPTYEVTTDDEYIDRLQRIMNGA